MKWYQFTTKTLLIGIVFGSVFFCAVRFWLLHFCDGYEIAGIIYSISFVSCFWLPFVFFAYAVGRRSMTWRFVMVFAVAETAAVAAVYYVPKWVAIWSATF
jgi:hypothetical protein